jgi:RNA-directed DNA polymerase
VAVTPAHAFDFLGYTFRPRRSKNRYGRLFTSFAPAVSNKAAKAMRQRMRGWRIQRRTDLDLDEFAQQIRPVVRGWVQYYAKFYPSALRCALRTLDHYVVRWARAQIQTTPGAHRSGAWGWLKSIRARQPDLFRALGPCINGRTIGAV